MQTTVTQTQYTPQQYWDLEQQAAARSEYRNGEIIEMAGASANHNRIAGEFYRRIPTEMGKQTYDSFIGDMKLSVPAMSLYTYPDVVVVQGEPVYHQDRTDIIENPHLILEVLSKSTRQYDQTDKFDAYRTLDSLQEYIMADQCSFWVKQFSRTRDNQWLLTEITGADAILQLTSIDVKMSLAELYRRVKFSEE